MKYKHLIGVLSAAALFAGCGSDGSSTSAVTTKYLNQALLSNGAYGTLVDSRDGRMYRTVKIGGQTWMAQNLNYKTDNSFCYEDKSSNCQKYGRLYKWYAATKACPDGWHLPSASEFQTLLYYVDRKHYSVEEHIPEIVMDELKSTSDWRSECEEIGWSDEIESTVYDYDNCAEETNGFDNYGFAALPAGGRFHIYKSGVVVETVWLHLHVNARFWTSTSGVVLDFGYDEHEHWTWYGRLIDFSDDSNDWLAISVRCLKDSD